MQQITLELGNDENDHPTPTLEPEREQRLIALMAQILVAMVQNQGEGNHEGE
jgi:hypothetical protein